MKGKVVGGGGGELDMLTGHIIRNSKSTSNATDAQNDVFITLVA